VTRRGGNDENRMTNIEGNVNGRNGSTLQRFNHLRLAKPPPAFTLIELVLVVGIITVLSALVLSTVGYARKKGARARAETEIAAMSAACENYKADNGVYPRDNATNQYTDTLNARQNFDATQAVYNNASFYLYTQLSGDSIGNRNPTGKSYMTFKPNMLLPPGGSGTVTAISDPFGNSYGYSTANQADPVTPKGYNPTFDLWSTAGGTTTGDTPKWIKNW
jgi:type II secretory pathway pseudopilin PulG